MYGNIMYEVARQRVAERERDARAAAAAHRDRAAARGRRRKQADEIATPAIPDYADDIFAAAGDSVPAPREEMSSGRHARSGK